MADEQRKRQRFRGNRMESFGDKMILRLFLVLTCIFALACLFPFILMLVSSFTDEGTLVREGYRLFPSKWSLNAYKTVLTSQAVPNAYVVTVITTLAGTFLSLLATSICSYAISGKMLKYRNVIAFIFYFTMLFSGGLVPSYILISKYLQLRNTIWVYILPVLVNPWNMFLMRNFFNTLPDSFRESASIDGANDFTILWRIVIPLSAPAMATIGLFYALGYWNMWMESMLYMDTDRLYLLQYLIMKIMRSINASKSVAQQSNIPMPILPSETIRYATAMLTIGPIILLYPFLQRYFVNGLRVGGIKG
ncbi:MAG: carbohydrate ABC transporter permease [Defluviitaleaceae bacterium]|nr:carbohydrate ABC transporter permease [Defluviitaleaceae bacterium]